jgi:hypothetical protein
MSAWGGTTATMQGTRAQGKLLSDAPGSCLPTDHPFRPPPQWATEIYPSKTHTATQAPCGQELAWNRPFDLQIQTLGMEAKDTPACPSLPCPGLATTRSLRERNETSCFLRGLGLSLHQPVSTDTRAHTHHSHIGLNIKLPQHMALVW